MLSSQLANLSPHLTTLARPAAGSVPASWPGEACGAHSENLGLGTRPLRVRRTQSAGMVLAHHRQYTICGKPVLRESLPAGRPVLWVQDQDLGVTPSCST